MVIHWLRVKPVSGREGPEEPGVLYKTFREGGGWVALPVEAAVEAAMPGIRAMLYPESHDPIGQVAEISVLRIYHLRDFIVQLPTLPHSSHPPFPPKIGGMKGDGKLRILRTSASHEGCSGLSSSGRLARTLA
jgi:hypothetical protein